MPPTSVYTASTDPPGTNSQLTPGQTEANLEAVVLDSLIAAAVKGDLSQKDMISVRLPLQALSSFIAPIYFRH